MKTITTALTTEVVFSDDRVKRHLLKKTWDKEKPMLAIIMLAPSDAAGVQLDNTTMLVLNNASRLGFGGVSILNLFATLNDFALKEAEDEDSDNTKAIVEAVRDAQTIVYAAGTGKAKNKVFLKRQQQVLEALRPYESKLHCLTSENGKARLQHPLSPAVRTWHLSPLKLSELLPEANEKESKDKPTEPKKRGRKPADKDAEPTT